MLKRLSRISWVTCVLLAVGWPLVWLLVSAGPVLIAFHARAANDYGGLATFSLGVTPLGALLVAGPPLLLLLLRAFAPHIRSS